MVPAMRGLGRRAQRQEEERASEAHHLCLHTIAAPTQPVRPPIASPQNTPNKKLKTHHQAGNRARTRSAPAPRPSKPEGIPLAPRLSRGAKAESELHLACPASKKGRASRLSLGLDHAHPHSGGSAINIFPWLKAVGFSGGVSLLPVRASTGGQCPSRPRAATVCSTAVQSDPGRTGDEREWGAFALSPSGREALRG